jgi:hypothetical protein
VVNSILDWRERGDFGNSHRIQGAKDEYYQGLNPPYHVKNGPLDDISELLLIKSAQEYYAPLPPAEAGQRIYNPMASHFNSEGANIIAPSVGLINLFATLGNGKININTASAEVLQLIPTMTPEAAQGIVSAREGEDDGSGLFGPWERPIEIDLPPAVNPARSPVWGIDSFVFFPNFMVLVWAPNWYLTYHYWPTSYNTHVFEGNVYFLPARTPRTAPGGCLGK